MNDLSTSGNRRLRQIPRRTRRAGSSIPTIRSLRLSRPSSTSGRSGGTTPPPPRCRTCSRAESLRTFFLRRFRLARTVEGDRLANERLEGGLVNFFSFVDVDRAACVSVETRVEETGRILQRRALGEGKLHDILVGFASADDAVVRPNRSAHPLPLLDDVRVCFLDELAHSAEGFPTPVPEFGDPFVNQLRCRLALSRARLFHVLILEVQKKGYVKFRRAGVAFGHGPSLGDDGYGSPAGSVEPPNAPKPRRRESVGAGR